MIAAFKPAISSTLFAARYSAERKARPQKVLAGAPPVVDDEIAETEPRKFASQEVMQSLLPLDQRQRCEASAIRMEQVEDEQDQLIGAATR